VGGNHETNQVFCHDRDNIVFCYCLFKHEKIKNIRYVMAIVDSPTTESYRWDYDMIDNARDLLFALDQLADNPPKGLEGIIDTDHVGVAGESGEGSTAFAARGARLDPGFYQSQCELFPVMVPNINWWSAFACSLTENWAAFASAVGSVFVTVTVLKG
jgi:hypothetical protein